MQFESSVGPYDNLNDTLEKITANFPKGAHYECIAWYALEEYTIPYDVALTTLQKMNKGRRKPQ